MKALTFSDTPAITAVPVDEVGVESRPGFSWPTSDDEDVHQGSGWWSALQTVGVVFCRAYPSLSGWLYALLGEDVAEELEE